MVAISGLGGGTYGEMEKKKGKEDEENEEVGVKFEMEGEI